MKEITDALVFLRKNGLITEDKYNNSLFFLQNGGDLDSLKNELIEIYENSKKISSFGSDIDDDIEIIEVFDDIEDIYILSVDDFKIDNMLFTKLNFSDFSIRIFKNDSGILGNEMFSRVKEQPNFTDLFLHSIDNQFFSEVILIDYSNSNDFNVSLIKSIYSDRNILFSNLFNFYILREMNQDDVLARITNDYDVQIIPFNNIYHDDFNKYDEIGNSNGNGFQKTHSTVAGRLFSDENGFMNFLFISFLTGISIGIISMVFINFMA